MTLLVALLSWAAQAADPLGHAYWNAVYKVWQRPAPASVVVVNGVDANELGIAGEARLLDIVRQAKPARMYLDFKLQGEAANAGNEALRASIAPTVAFGASVVNGAASMAGEPGKGGMVWVGPP